MVVGTHQSFQFSRQIPWFLGNNRALPNLGIRFCVTLLVLSNFKKNKSIKANFRSTARATLDKNKHTAIKK